MFHVPEAQRLRRGPQATRTQDGNNGAFFLPPIAMDWMFVVIASDGALPGDEQAWEHVSVHMTDRREFFAPKKDRPARQRTPSWDEMCHIKSIFWDPEDVVIQYHPAETEYVSIHDHTLHLWRPVGIVLPTPPVGMIGPVTGQRHG